MAPPIPALFLIPVLAFSAAPEARLLQGSIRAGGLAVVELDTPAELPSARFGESRHRGFPHPSDPRHRSVVLVPIPVTTKPGPQHLEVESAGGAPQRLAFTVTPCPAPVLNVKVAPGKVEPSAEDKARILREREEILAIYAASEPRPLWTGPFADPLSSPMTCAFGTTRRFNGKLQSIHKGMDLRAATGTPVKAPANGTVRLAKDLFFGGNLVLIDHGCGLFTSLAHLSRIEVKPGQSVSKGQRIGLSGATGRVSGPHLHWGNSLDGVEVDPREVKRVTTTLSGTASPQGRH